MVSFTRDRIRVAVNAAQKADEFVDVISNQSPAAWRGAAIQVEFAIFYGEELVNVADYSSITLEVRDYNQRTGNLLMAKTIAVANMNAALAVSEWEAQTSQHGILSFPSAETNLDLLGSNARNLWMVFSAIAAVDSEPLTLGGALFTMLEDGSLIDGRAIPPLGSSLVPLNSFYNGAGQYVLPVTAGRNHLWTKAANDVSLVNGTETLVATGSFVAQGSTVVMTGTASAPITATVRYPVYLTADEADARYRAGVSRVVKPNGQVDLWHSANGAYRRFFGVSDAGLPIDKIEAIP